MSARLLARFLAWASKPLGFGSMDTMVREFTERFPGRCPVCSFHAFGRREGLTAEASPGPHFCPEAESAKSPKSALTGVDTAPEGGKAPCSAISAPCTGIGKEGSTR